MQSLHTQREDLISSFIDKLILRITSEYLDLRENDTIEIVSPYEEESFVEKLVSKLHELKIHDIYVTYTNGPAQKEINQGYRKFLDERKKLYEYLISKEFTRITLLSPFAMPTANTEEMSLYKKHVNELSFVNEYLMTHQRCMVLKPNQKYADHLGITLTELWKKINTLYEEESYLDSIREKLDSYHFKALHFKTSEGTDAEVGLASSFAFTGKRISFNGRIFQPNAPSFEIFTSPLKYGTNGKFVFTKPLFYNGRKITNHEIELRNGKIIHEKNMSVLLGKDDSLGYLGEIALCPFKEDIFEVTLLDENTGCHVAIGNSYPYGIKSSEELNHSLYHVDLIFGSKTLFCEGIMENGERIPVFDNGRCVI